ncbi:hypothetical protein KUTeg_011216 [Tegillarca granosa]|uniref:poly(ADP-ribose) glycohydrolase n=1 Tax=Tegillarca granosa TaxID=220873 RepID=A0ABQ9F4T6_TEGGR|nr:hypothetical protein KUTeg_011216 [Tegillarca granosa]
MKDTFNYVEFPCEKSTWPQVRELLEDLKNVAQHQNCNLEELAKAHQVVVNINSQKEHRGAIDFGSSTFYGLVKFLKKYASHEERRLFLQSTLPAIIDLALEIPNVIPFDGLMYSRQQCVNQTELSRSCIASILACAFLCLFEARDKPWKTGSYFNIINFDKFFVNLPSPSQNAKIRCILSYFEQVAEQRHELHGNVIFIRQVIPSCELPSMDTWLNCQSELCPLIAHREGVIEDAGFDAIHIDFANRYIGGGVLGGGRVQEEIKFTVCPELIASMLFMECMDHNEAIVIKGFEQYTLTSGYAASLQYVGPYKDPAMIKKDDSASDEEFLTADEGESEPEEEEVINSIYNLADGLVVEIMSSALLEACSALCQKSGNENKTPQNGLDTENYGECDGMDYLDVDVQEWYNRFRRRSSNLSDITSRRSSCEILSRRSSCSRYSSDFSSEFEEFYDNFQKREQMFVNPTIKEEVCSPTINEFASSLVASILQEGTFEAAHTSSGLQKFHDHIPVEKVARPKARKVSEENELKTLQTVDPKNLEQDFRRSLDDDDDDDDDDDKNDDIKDDGHYISLPSNELDCDANIKNYEVNSFVDSVITQSADTICTDTAEKFADQLLAMIFPAAVEIVRNSVKEQFSNIPGNSKGDNSKRKMNDNSQENVCKLKAGSDKGESSKNKLNDNSLEDVCKSKEGSAFKDNRQSNQTESKNIITHGVQGVASNFDSQALHSVKCEEKSSTTQHNSLASFKTSSPADKPALTGMPADEHNMESFEEADLEKGMSSDSLAAGDGYKQTAEKFVQQILTSVSEKLSHEYQDSQVQAVESMQKETLDEGQLSKKENQAKVVCQNKDIPKVILTAEQNTGKTEQELFYEKIAERLVHDAFITDQTTSSKFKENHTKCLKNSEDVTLETQSVEQKTKTGLMSKFLSDDKVTFNIQNCCGGIGTSSKSEGTRKVTSFASSLSRDLLTNAFVEVQRNYNGGNYYRRSSEPLQLSNQAALGLKDLSEEMGPGRKRKVKSRADEDIGSFVEELARHGGSVGDFGSKFDGEQFAEELMRSQCKVPEFVFMDSTNMSTSGSSSRSRQSSISGFKDNILASFEDELLNSSFGRTSSRGSRKRSKKLKQVSIQKNANLENSLDIKDGKYSSKGWRGMSFDSEASGFSWRSFQSSSPSSFEEISDYAERLAQNILEESLKTVFRDQLCPSTTCHSTSKPRVKSLDEYASDLASNIVLECLLKLANQNCKHSSNSSEDAGDLKNKNNDIRQDNLRTDGSSSTGKNHGQRSRSLSDEFTDAFDIPYAKIEQFAQNVATDVIKNSAMVFKREKQCELKRKYGRPISTGNWGCGAFRGDPCLKSMLQWIAASYAGVPYVLFYTFQHPSLFKVQYM